MKSIEPTIGHIEIDPEDKVNKIELLEMKNHPGKKFALFVRSPSSNSAKFRLLFDSKEAACEKAQEYFVKRVADGKTNFTFYVVELKHMIGIEDGKLIDKEIL